MICGKTIYNSRASAIDAIKGMLSDADGRSSKHPSRAYFCEQCEGWHVHTENWNKGKKRKQKSRHEVDSKSEATKNNEIRQQVLIVHDPRKFKVK